MVLRSALLLSLGIVSSKSRLPHGNLRKENMKRRNQLCSALLTFMDPFALMALESRQRREVFYAQNLSNLN